MLDKTILVFYINVGSQDPSEVAHYIAKLKEVIMPKEEDKDKVIQYIIPVRDQETRVECINAPLFVTSEVMSKEVIKKMEETNDKLDRITSYINADSEMRTVIVEKF